VIAISGIIITIAGSSYITAQRQSRDVRRIQDIKNTQTAFEQYHVISGAYPNITDNNIISAFQGSIPVDPQSTNNAYEFGFTTATAYCICATMEGKGGNANVPDSTVCNWDNSGGDYFCVQNQQ
jgi:type II secretory pathway pseudopilin PulG